jgi:hypothetical protein
MGKVGDFIPQSVVYGLKFGEFRQLPMPIKKKLVRLMARIAEKSYRRGFQHGTLGRHTIDPEEFRSRRSLDKSPFTDGPGGMTAIGRLMAETHLEQVGLDAD